MSKEHLDLHMYSFLGLLINLFA